MPKALPARPNVEHLKEQAKDLLDDHRRGARDALARFREELPAARGADDTAIAAMRLALHDAQSVIAREYGFTSWASLRAHVEGLALSAETLRALLAPHLSRPLPPEVETAIARASDGNASAALASGGEIVIPPSVPVVAVRNAVVAVGAVAPLAIARPSSVAAAVAAQAAAAQAEEGAKLLALFSQKNEATEEPSKDDLHPVGCLAWLALLATPPGRGTWIVVRGLRWIRLESIGRNPSDGRLDARVQPFDVDLEPGRATEIRRLELRLRERVNAFAAKLPDGEAIRRMTDRMAPLELADSAIANLPCSVDDKARYAGESSLIARLEYVLELLDRAA